MFTKILSSVIKWFKSLFNKGEESMVKQEVRNRDVRANRRLRRAVYRKYKVRLPYVIGAKLRTKLWLELIGK